MTYQPGVGVQYTAALSAADIGNVPNPARIRNPAGTPGRMNGGNPADAHPEGTIYYLPKPGPDDVTALAELYNVGERTIERWFGVADAQGRVQYRNCVPMRSSAFSTVPGALGTRLCSMNYDTRARCLLAACLSVSGGIYRTPLYTGGDKKNNGEPYSESTSWDTLAECIEQLEGIIDGDIDYLLMVGWVQLTIVPGVGGGWDVIVYRNYPKGDEYTEKTVEAECPG